MQVNMHEAKTQLSKLAELVAGGEEVIIAKAGKPVMKMVPYKAESAPRKPGLLANEIEVSDDAFSRETDRLVQSMFEDSVE